jgi:hypothetical protein
MSNASAKNQLLLYVRDDILSYIDRNEDGTYTLTIQYPNPNETQSHDFASAQDALLALTYIEEMLMLMLWMTDVQLAAKELEGRYV